MCPVCSASRLTKMHTRNRLRRVRNRQRVEFVMMNKSYHNWFSGVCWFGRSYCIFICVDEVVVWWSWLLLLCFFFLLSPFFVLLPRFSVWLFCLVDWLACLLAFALFFVDCFICWLFAEKIWIVWNKVKHFEVVDIDERYDVDDVGLMEEGRERERKGREQGWRSS